MIWNAQTRARLQSACRATLLAKKPHSTKVELVRVTFVVEFRDGQTVELSEEAWK